MIITWASCLLCHAQEIDSLHSPKLWLAADRSPLTDSKWTDLSIFHHDAIGSSAQATPHEYQLLNFNKALVFDGIDDYLNVSYSLESTPEISVLAVFQSRDTTERGIYATENAILRKILATTRRALGPDTVTDAYGKFEGRITLSSIIQNWEAAVVAPAASPSSFVIGTAGLGKPFKPYQGALAELLVFDHALSSLERVQYETYLAVKYGTGLRGGNFVSSGEHVLWRVAENSAYGNNIAGIGRDDHFHLHQKQSGSAYDSGFLQMSVGAIALSNEANTGSLPNEHFILWGDNAKGFTAKAGSGEDSLVSILERKWLVTANGAQVSTLGTEMYIDIAKLPSYPMGYWLVIDRSGQSNFSIDNLEYISPDRVSDGKLIFKNVSWDTDGSGKDSFSFAQKRNLLAVVRKVSDPLCHDEDAGRVRIEVVAGKPSFSFTLKNSDQTISRSWKDNVTSSDQRDLTAGSYTLTVEDNAHERLTRKFTLVQPNLLQVDLGPDKVFDQNNPIQLDASTFVSDTTTVEYHWTGSFGFSSIAEKIQVPESGVYRVSVIRQSDGCAFSDEINITGSEVERMSVYPTVVQSNDPYNVAVSLPKAASVSVKIFNSRGVFLQEMSGNDNSEYLFTTSVNDPGIYVIVIQTPKGIETRKIVGY